MSFRHWFAAAAMTVAAPAMFLQACAGGDIGEGPTAGAGAPNKGPQAFETGVCLLNDCHSDQECGGCQDGRSRCLANENRCVACDPKNGTGCKGGEDCSPYGICVPHGQTCGVDDHGEPTVKCGADADCKACDPMHQVCAAGHCVACTQNEKQHCLQSDICFNNQCQPKCPKSCATDGECSQCGGPGNEAHACNAHKCAECSDAVKCADGMQCQNGTCVPGCGIPKAASGDCISDEDCKFCGAGDAKGSFVCKKAINSGKQDHGKCVPKAEGCSDLGKGVAVLPEPWSQVTNTCSSDANCKGVSIDLNVGKLIRDAIGSDNIDLGFKKIKIQDANVSYGMNACANIDITESISCGVCVPCKVDGDCKPIQIDPLVSNLFKGDPLAQIAGSFLVDLLYGDNKNHAINFFCQDVASGYGVCAPCSNPAQACGQGGGGGGGGGSCPHGVCSQGAALKCNDSCASKVCANDSYCCDTAWDDVCVGEVGQYCGQSCGGSSSSSSSSSGGGGGGCIHDECSAGAKLAKNCSSCAASVCASDSYCCNTEWDSTCVDEAKNDPSCSCY